MSAQLRRAETVHKVQKHKLQRFGVRDDEMEETGQEGNKTVRGGNSGIMTLVEDKVRACVDDRCAFCLFRSLSHTTTHMTILTPNSIHPIPMTPVRFSWQ